MDQKNINRRFLQAVEGSRRHSLYPRAVSLAKRYTALSTGLGINDLLKPYTRREDAQLFQVRADITQHITTSVVSGLAAYTEKAFRSHYHRILHYGDGATSDAKAAEMEAAMSEYAGGLGVDGYLKDRILALNQTDPNAWIVQEWYDFDNLKQYAEPYPFEVSSANAVDFNFERGKLAYLTVMGVAPGDEETPKKRFTCYQPNKAATLTQTGNLSAQQTPLDAGLVPGMLVYIDGHEWIYEEFISGLSEIKAFRVGFRPDLQTGGKSFVWPFFAAEPYLMKSLKAVSELDLTSANAAMPLTIRYGDECNAPGCADGYLDTGAACGTCKGTGKKTSPTSVMEEIVVSPMPSNPADILDLSKLHVYVSPDVSILNWQAEYVDKLEAKCRRAYLNSEIFDGTQIQETATGKEIDQQNANDVVYRFFTAYAEKWRFTVYAFAEITGREKGLVARIVVGRDLKLKTRGELLGDLEAAKNAGAGAAAINAIEWDLMRIIYADDEEAFLWWEARNRFEPFKGHSIEQRLFWAQSPIVPLSTRVLYANFSEIFEKIGEMHSNFHRLNVDAQRAIVDKMIQDLLSTMPNPEQTPNFEA